MNLYEKYVGGDFPIPDTDIGGSCIDYWFDKEEVDRQTKCNPLVPLGFKAVARDAGDNLILQADNGEIYYCDHEDGRLIKLAKEMAEFLDTVKVE